MLQVLHLLEGPANEGAFAVWLQCWCCLISRLRRTAHRTARLHVARGMSKLCSDLAQPQVEASCTHGNILQALHVLNGTPQDAGSKAHSRRRHAWRHACQCLALLLVGRPCRFLCFPAGVPADTHAHVPLPERKLNVSRTCCRLELQSLSVYMSLSTHHTILQPAQRFRFGAGSNV